MTQPARNSDIEQRRLRVVIRVVPETDCPVVEFDGHPEHIQAQLAGGRCLCNAIVEESEPIVEQTEKDLDESCVCSIFHKHACVADITTADDRAITITTHVADREVIEDLIEDLENVGEAVELREITTNHEGDIVDRVERVDLTSLTEKQRAAVELAIEEGYYSRPRETNLAEMANELDISQQALSQRLGAVEEKLITQLFTKS